MKTYLNYEISLTTLSPLRIGGMKQLLGHDVDLPILKVGGRFAIPGSSLKGVYRANLEKYLIDTYLDKTNHQWNDESMKPCIPSEYKAASPNEQELIKNHLYKSCCKVPNYDKDSICPVCYLLGCQGLVGFVEVPFLFMEQGTLDVLPIIRTDRVTGTASSGALAKYEAIPDGIRFSGTLSILFNDDILIWSIGKPRRLARTERDYNEGDKWLSKKTYETDQFLKEFIEDRFQNIDRLGGFKSKGFGKVKIELRRL